MYILHVNVHVKPECVDAFVEATTENARNSLQEPGVARFDVLQQTDTPNRFRLVEVYRTPGGVPRHKETSHYAKWNQSVAGMMAEPRTKAIYENRFPGDESW